MFSRITLENFFSFKGPTTIELNPGLNILLGINGSGKSNLLKAIQLLSQAIIGNGLESIFLKIWGGFPTVANFNANEKDYIKLSFEFNKEVINNLNNQQGFQFRNNPIYELTIYRVGLTSYGLAEKLYLKNFPNPDFIFMEMNNAQGIISTREEGSVGIQKYPQDNQKVTFKSTEPVLSQVSDPERFYPLFTLKRALEYAAVYSNFDTSFSSFIRQPASYGTETKLLSDGQNLTTIINKIKNNHFLSYEKIEKAIQKINPFFKDISFDFIGSKLYLVLRENNLSRSVSIEQISDGTLRYLLLLSVLFNPERGNLVCLEEPETNLHPDMINTIAEALKQASTETQIILTTHSPLLLNLFELEDVLVFEKNEGNETVVNYNFTDEIDEDFLVGQSWLQGWIGGKRW
ncbi:AAA family ATPase [Oscillatoria acuminata]|uniref:Putative ATPase n=1 Tax=Oscillatoria acuminata PCC 6304 TaxID=56110 RepID=K9TM06_9CYAN|nr:AAA family ATPase [Oscillatoria acuminata]AFY83186.1 putative ATPase [Oscillatoria acuminata PCC 6304]